MVEINVVLIRQSPQGQYIGRPSPLGNPFVIGPDGTREEVIAKYDIWLNKRLENPGSAQSIELRRLTSLAMTNQQLDLCCFCAPKACHGDIIKAKIEEILDD